MNRQMQIDINKSFLFPALFLIITLYFAYHSIQGARGYRRLNQVHQEIILAQQIANQTRIRKELLETKVSALAPDSLDLDQLEESALRTLNMGKKEDFILLAPTTD